VATGYNVDIFRACVLKVKAYFGEFRNVYGAPHTVLGNLVVLAIYAPQIAAGYENGA
jgi:hypothetical protein